MNRNRFTRSLPAWASSLFGSRKLLDFPWRLGDSNLPFWTGCLLAFSVAAGIEAGRLLGIAVPMPLLLLFAAVVLGANIGGMRGGLATVAAATFYLIYAATVSADLPGFSGEPASVAGSIVLFLAIAIVVGRTQDRNRAPAELEGAGRDREEKVQELSAELSKVREQLLEAIASQNSLDQITAKHDGSPPDNLLDRPGGLARIKASLKSQGARLSLLELLAQLECKQDEWAQDAQRLAREELKLHVRERRAELVSASELLGAETAARAQAQVEKTRLIESLQEGEEGLQIALKNLKNSPSIIFHQDKELRYTWVYNVAREFEGEQVVGRLDSELLPPEDAQRLTDIKRQVLETGVARRTETFLSLNGEVRHYDLIVEPLQDSSGEVTGIICAATDITEIRFSEGQMRAIFDSALDAILIADNEGRYIEANPAASQLLGLPRSEILGKQIADFMQPGFDFELAWQVFLEQEQLSGQISLVRPDGKIRIAEYAARANFLPGRHLSLLRDITERKQAELDLVEERNFVATILDTAAVLVVVMDSQGRIDRFNRACQEMTGYSLAQVRGKYVWDLFPIAEEVEVVKEVFQELLSGLSGRVPNHYENYWLARDGSRRLISWSNAVLLDLDGSVKHVIGTGIDISDRAAAEQADRALEREQELSQLRLSFFTMASHEFRTPLSSILVAVQSLLYFASNWPENKKILKHRQIESAAQRMNRLIENILTINRAETGKLEFHPTELNLVQFCLDVVGKIQENAGSNYSITSRVQGEGRKSALMDETLLYFILANLLSNAIKYSPDGGEVHLALTCQQGQAIFEIRDRGIGIPPQDLPHIFEAFYRGENIGKVAGSGLGLTVVKKCLELHGGTVAATSTLGAGSTFVVTLPLN